MKRSTYPNNFSQRNYSSAFLSLIWGRVAPLLQVLPRSILSNSILLLRTVIVPLREDIQRLIQSHSQLATCYICSFPEITNHNSHASHHESLRPRRCQQPSRSPPRHLRLLRLRLLKTLSQNHRHLHQRDRRLRNLDLRPSSSRKMQTRRA